MPRMIVVPEQDGGEDADEVIKGHPEHGQAYREPGEDGGGDGVEEEGRELDEGGEDEGDGEEADEVAGLREQLAELRGELRAQRPQPRQEPPEPEDDEPDWEKLLYKDPKAAMRLQEERITTKVTKQLRQQYQADQSEQQFWSEFYRQNSDLREDDDLVRATLQSNTGKLGNLPVEAAAKELADLTRARILRYAGVDKQKGKGGKKAVAEGANSPQQKKPPKQESKVVTLGDIIRRNKEKRARGVAA